MYINYDQHYSENRSLLQKITDIPFYISQLFIFMLSREGMIYLFRYLLLSHQFLVIGILLFVIISPFDLLPEAFLGVFGILDDLVYILIMLLVLVTHFRNYLLHRQEVNG